MPGLEATSAPRSKSDKPAFPSTLKQPLPILLQTFADYTTLKHDFFFQLVSFFKPLDVKSGDIIFRQGEEPNGLYLIESGCLRATYRYEDYTDPLQETMVAGTVAGELTMLSATKRNATVVAERDAKLWILDVEQLERLQKEKPEVAREFIKILLGVAAQETDMLASHLIAVLS